MVNEYASPESSVTTRDHANGTPRASCRSTNFRTADMCMQLQQSSIQFARGHARWASLSVPSIFNLYTSHAHHSAAVALAALMHHRTAVMWYTIISTGNLPTLSYMHAIPHGLESRNIPSIYSTLKVIKQNQNAGPNVNLFHCIHATPQRVRHSSSNRKVSGRCRLHLHNCLQRPVTKVQSQSKVSRVHVLRHMKKR